uniref:Uncharacterized protein n=1 Tax=candidate division WOR-3 bacterium TaxID=2052148 RepID=A0A7C4XB88_UNCW3
MKITKFLVLTMLFFSPLKAQEEEPLAEKIKKVSLRLLEDYTQPLITSFGTGVSTGLFHSAKSHNFLGFDIGLRGMYITIPDFAKTFDAKVLVCSLQSGKYEYDSLVIEDASTIFGPKVRKYVPVSGNTVGIPPYIPEGFDRTGVPFFMPQLNVGLIFGSELAVRYIPVTFHGSSVHFLGLGIKQNLNKLPFMKNVFLPIDFALGGAIQNFYIMDSLRNTILSSRTWNLQILASKDLIVFEPMIGFGLEGTDVHFEYDFEYEVPDPNGEPGDRIKRTDHINVNMSAQNNNRLIAGFTLKLAILYIHYDYNLTPHYKTHNGIIGFTIR